MLSVESRVPCETVLSCWLYLHGVKLESLVQQSRTYERAWLAWETVRLVRNPFFREGTGFEGYFVGLCHSPDEMSDRLLEIGREILACNRRMYPHEFAFKKRMMQTLTGEIDDAQAVSVWATLLGTALGKLRRNTCMYAVARDFQNETYRSVYRLPPVRYTQHAYQIRQEYCLSPYWKTPAPKPDLRLDAVRPEDQDAALVMSQIGRFGHPLVRAYLRAANPNWWHSA